MVELRLYLYVILAFPSIAMANGYYKSEKNLKVFTPSNTISKNQGYIIKDSNMIFDCKGKILDGKGKISSAVVVESYGKNISNIMIKNCTFKNFGHGIRIGWGEEDTLKGDKKNIYEKHPSNIIIDNVQIINSKVSAIYIDDHVSHVKIINSIIKDSGTAAIYLEFSSKNNIIMNNIFVRNGFKDGKPVREAIAIDGSFNNIIKNNTFYSNAKGSVFLYKNCQEHVSTGKSAVRKDGANHNKIINNKFLNEDIGVWIASRQSRNLSKLDCGDKPIFENKYYIDYADYNNVSRNTFCNVKKPIIIEGDYNTVQKNNSYGKPKLVISLPTTPRSIYLNQPQTGNTISKNMTLSELKKCDIKLQN